MAYRVALGEPWGGRRVVKADTIYVAAEGMGGMAKRVEGMPPGMSRSLGVMSTKMTEIADASKAAGDATAGAFGKIDTAAATTAGNLANISREMKSIAAESRAVNGPASLRSGAPAVIRARGTDGGGTRFTTPGVGAGGFRIHGGEHGPMIGAAALAYGAYEEAQIESIIARAMLTGQIKVDEGMRQSDAFQQMRDLIQRIAGQTGFGPREVGQALLTTERQFGGLSFKDRLGIEETLIPFAAAEARMKETSLSEAFEAMVGLSHMTGTYDPKQLPELMRQFQYASMITPVGIEQFQRAISYSLPMLHAGLDMDPSAVMFLTAMTQTAGITNTKSGTWLRSFFENAEPRIGASKTDLAHNEALRKMGLLDDSNNVTWQVKDAQGKTDWDKSILAMSQAINKFTQSTDPAVRLGLLRQGFGERGGGEAALMNLTQFIDQFAVLQAKMKAFQGGDSVISALNNTTAQKADVAWAQTQNVLMDLGQTVLPIVNTGLDGLTAALKAVQKALGPDVANPLIGGGLLAGLAAWKWSGLLTGAARVGGFLGLGGAAAGAVGLGVYAASELSTPEAARHIAAQPDPGYAERKRINDALNPTAKSGPYGNGGAPGASFKGAIPVVNVSPPQVSVAPTSVAVQVFVDAELVAEKVAESIARFAGRTTNSSFDFDGRMGFAGPDVRN
jgi:hypothetical protein